MWTKYIILVTLLFTIYFCEHALPLWVPHDYLIPSLADLAILLICVNLRGREAVLFAGLMGLLQDDFYRQPVGMGLMAACSLAVLAQWFHRDEDSLGFIDQTLAATILAMVLCLTHVTIQLINDPTANASVVGNLQAARMAFTLLLCFLLQGCLALIPRGVFSNSVSSYSHR